MHGEYAGSEARHAAFGCRESRVPRRSADGSSEPPSRGPGDPYSARALPATTARSAARRPLDAGAAQRVPIFLDLPLTPPYARPSTGMTRKCRTVSSALAASAGSSWGTHFCRCCRRWSISPADQATVMIGRRQCRQDTRNRRAFLLAMGSKVLQQPFPLSPRPRCSRCQGTAVHRSWTARPPGSHLTSVGLYPRRHCVSASEGGAPMNHEGRGVEDRQGLEAQPAMPMANARKGWRTK